MDEPATGQVLSALTHAIAQGDSSAFGRFYDQWFDALFRMARANTGRDESFCLDVVQEAMLKVMKSMKRFDEHAELEAWLRVIVMRCALDMMRSERRRAARESTHAKVQVHSRRQTELPGDDEVAWLESQLARLDAERSLLVAMRFRLGATLGRISRVVGLAPGAVDGRINRSLARIRAAAQEELDEHA